MSYISMVGAFTSSFISSLIFYLGCPNQQWFTRSYLGLPVTLLITFILWAVAFCLFRYQLSVLSSVFSVLVVFMLALGVTPFLSRISSPRLVRKKMPSRLIKSNTAEGYQPRWLLRIIGVLLLNYPLAVGVSGVIVNVIPGQLTDDIKSQFAMWLVTPLCLIPLSLAFLFHRVSLLLISLAGLNLIVFGLLWMIDKA